MIAALVMPWIAAALGLGAAAGFALALRARSLVIAVLAIASSSALIAAATLALGYGDAALALALIGVGLMPLLLLGGLLLSARTIKLKPGRAPWTVLVFALFIAMVLFGALIESAPQVRRIAVASHSSVFGFAPLVLAMAASCLALLGFGERGALDHPPMGREP